MGLFDKLKKNPEANKDQLFLFDKEEDCFVATINSIRFECDNLEEITEEYVKELADTYASKLEVIAEHMMEDIKEFYEEISVEELIEALGAPIIRPDVGVITYVEHSLDDCHIIDVEFDGVFDPLTYVTIDG